MWLLCVPTPDDLESALGQDYPRDDLLDRLVRYGYGRDEQPGFVVRGDTVTVYLEEDPDGDDYLVPFTLALLRYAMDIDAGNAGEPEDVVLNDRVLQALAVLWLVPLGIGIFAR